MGKTDENICDDLRCMSHHGVAYQQFRPIFLPSTLQSYRNLRYPDFNDPFNQYSRHAGTFFWRQFHRAIESISSSMGKQVYVAMFDEVDEATAIMKIAETKDHVPLGVQFLTMDADGKYVPNDWYLRLVGEASKMLKTEGYVPEDMPSNSSTKRGISAFILMLLFSVPLWT
jgi:hypothetical protein